MNNYRPLGFISWDWFKWIVNAKSTSLWGVIENAEAQSQPCGTESIIHKSNPCQVTMFNYIKLFLSLIIKTFHSLNGIEISEEFPFLLANQIMKRLCYHTFPWRALQGYISHWFIRLDHIFPSGVLWCVRDGIELVGTSVYAIKCSVTKL